MRLQQLRDHGVDGLDVAFQGALPQDALDALRQAKEKAAQSPTQSQEPVLAAHPRTRARPGWSKAADTTHPAAVLSGRRLESVTVGKMPGRQVIVYDKRREAIERNNPRSGLCGLTPLRTSVLFFRAAGTHRRR